MNIYTCPISHGCPRVPVITNEGITYNFVSLARNLLWENTRNIPLDPPTTDGAINILIYNHSTKELNDALMGAPLPLSNEEKTEIASLYTQLISRYPRLKIYGLHTLAGMQALIGAPMPAIWFSPQPTLLEKSLWDAAAEGNLHVVMAWLTAGANINQARTDGATPLFIAANNGHVTVVTALLAAGAALEAMIKGVTPLLAAAINEHLTVVTTLLDAGANINQVMSDGTTLLSIAAEKGHLDLVRVLLTSTASINQARADGITPLYFAAQNGHVTVVTTLLDAGANITLARADGRTPLLIAALKGHVTVVSALLDAEAAPNKAMTDGATPLYTAALFNHFEVVRALLHHQTKGTLNNSLSIAVKNGYLALVRALLSDATIRDYYLNQIIKNPELMRNALIQNPVFFAELAAHRNELWDRLCGLGHFNLPPNEHKALLISILNSRQVPNKALPHPLHTLFSAPLAPPRPSSITSFFIPTSNITLGDIRAYVNTTYPHQGARPPAA